MCGYDLVHQASLLNNPNFDADRNAYLQSAYKRTAGAKKTASSPLYVPVVFHIILDDASISQMDMSTLLGRINTQMDVLNQDYNRGNIDSSGIPAAFKPLYASANIKFALTGIDPSGNPTPGYEFIHTTKTGFDVLGSGAGSDAKHASTGGANAWDVTKYVNIWVVNTIPSSYLGLTVNKSNTVTGGYPANEMGIVLSYQAFGKRTFSTEYFLSPFDQGRTLTHEMGHYFELLHIWGDDGGACTGDDGLTDTPPQGNNSSGCPTFPKLDACSGTPPGVMFMNYMDYTDDICMHMFTQQQADRMYSMIDVGGENHELTTHHELLSVPEVSNIAQSISISPNPTSGNITITFEDINSDLHSIIIMNAIGQKIKDINITNHNISYSTSLSGFPAGMYFVECNFKDGKEIRKIILQ